MVNTNVKYIVGGVVTTAVLAYGYLGNYSLENQFSENISGEIKVECCLPTEYYNNDHYSIKSLGSDMNEQIEIVHNFVSSLLENTQDLDPRISKLIDENFWELG